MLWIADEGFAVSNRDYHRIKLEVQISNERRDPATIILLFNININLIEYLIV
jgi:hypothetical protein